MKRLAVLLLALVPVLALGAVPARAATTKCVGVVVAPQGMGGRPSDHHCTTVDSGASGADVLAQRATDLGRPQPRYENGLLCSIDGLPATGCGDSAPGGGYRYWSYWKRAAGASDWSYSSTGVQSSRPPDGAEEGWSWVDGGTESSARKPPLVDPQTVCPQLASSSAAPSTVPATTSPTTAAAPPTTTGPTGRSQAAVVGSAPAGGSGGPGTTQASVSPTGSETASPAGSTAAEPDLASPTGTFDPTVVRAEPQRARTGGGGVPVSTVVGVVVVTALVVAGTVAARRRSG